MNRRQAIRRISASGIAVGLAGCGVGDYEALVSRTHERMRHVDELNDLLGEPLQLPDKPTKVYLRPPKNIALKPSPHGVSGFEWLHYFPSTDTKAELPPLEMFVGLQTRGGEDFGDALKRMDLNGFVRKKYDAVWMPPEGRQLDEIEVIRVTLESEPASQRSELRYDRLTRLAEEKAPWRSAAADLPEKCLFLYQVNVFGNLVEPRTAYWAVVIFKQLNRVDNEKKWKANYPAAVERLPAMDLERMHKQKELCLATLRLGKQAETYFAKRQ